MKRLERLKEEGEALSPPMRRRGLKLSFGHVGSYSALVASHAEAWIETQSVAKPLESRLVASHAEAWIETGLRPSSLDSGMVASHAEAWIETLCPS